MRKFAGLSLVASLYWSLSAAGQKPLYEEMIPNDDWGKSIFLLEKKGLRLKSPAPQWSWLLQKPNHLWSSIASFSLGGDFEFSASYDVTGIGVPGQPITQEGNAELSAQSGVYGTVGINVGVRPNIDRCFNVLRVHPNKAGTHFNILTFPRKSDQGRISMKRVGDELIFEFADGKNAPFVEAVRYPFASTINVTPRMSIYQDNARFPTPVNVLLDDLTLKAATILRDQARFTAKPLPSPPSYPVKIDYSKNPAQVLVDFSRTNDPSPKKGDTPPAFRVEGGAIRVNPFAREKYNKSDQGYYYHDTKVSFSGDFGCSFRYDVKKLGPIGPEGYGSVAVGMNIETDSKLGSFSVSRGMDRNGHRFTITRYSPTSKGDTWDTQVIRCQALNTGRLVIRRTGKDLIFLAEEGENAPLVELSRQPFTDRPVNRLRLVTDQGGNPTNAVDVMVTDLTLQASRFYDPEKPNDPEPPKFFGSTAAPDQKEPIVLEAAPRAPSNRGLYVTILVGGGVLAIAAILIVALRRSKSVRAGSR